MSDLYYLLGCKLVTRMSFARKSSVAGATLGEHVLHIIRRCTYREMIWSDTRRVVTSMDDEQSSGHWSIVSDLPSNTMGI